MPRRQRELAQVVPFPSRSLVASATRYKGRTARIYNEGAKDWQKQAYRHYRICGEARFSAQFFGHALSKAQLYISSGDAHKPRLDSGPAVEALEELFNGSEGQAAMLSAMGTHLTIAGECYLIGRTDKNTDAQIWEIRSVMEVHNNGAGGMWWIQQDGAIPSRIDLTDNDVVIRIWTPDPERSIDADSAFRSLLPILDEIEWLTKYVFAQCTSRLAGAGVWMVPEEIDFPPPPGAADHPEWGKADRLLAYLADIMLKPIEDPSLASAKVPGIVTMPGEHIAQAKEGWLSFWSHLDSEAKALRGEAIQRFALGMDLPMERILGMSSNMGSSGGRSNGVSHWGAWQIDEDTIKMHIEPMLEVIVAALSIYYVRPGSNDDTAVVGYDTAKLRLRPDRSQEAMELWDRGLVKPEVVIAENGFEPSEMMDETQQRRWLLLKVASGSATPDMVAAALSQLGIDLPMLAGPTPPMPNESRPPPSLMDHPTRDLPDRAASLQACEALVYRALERAGNRLKQEIRKTGGTVPDVASYRTHTLVKCGLTNVGELLDDAWPTAGLVLDDAERVVPVLDSYVSNLLVSGAEHTRDNLAKWLASS